MNNLLLVSSLVILIVEFILGKTKWIKSNSTIELILSGLVKILKLFKRG